MTEKCEYCGADIRLSKTKDGKAVALSVPPDKRYIMHIKPDGTEAVKLVETWEDHYYYPHGRHHHRAR